MSLSLLDACSPQTFGTLSIFGAEIFSINAALVTNYSTSVPAAYRYTQPSTELQNATFCNITVSYTHPGQNDNVSVEAWLPIDNFNGRLQAVGGGGWVAGGFFLSYNAMNGALADGYATITTDAGLPGGQEESPYSWALLSPGNVNLHLLQNMGSVSLNDQAIIGKSLVKSFYGKGPEYSYFNGCSQGGRQALMLAQRYPTAYDGIAAGAPAVQFTQVCPYTQWPQQFMNMLGTYPYGCELDAITAAAVSACDGLDGVVDGVVGETDACLAHFNPFGLVGTVINCTEAGGEVQISRSAAAVANATWNGMVTADGKRTSYGILPGSDLTGGSSAGQVGLAATNCTTGTCVGAPTYQGAPWIKLFVARSPKFDISNLTHAEFDRLAHLGGQMYESIIDAKDPDLSAFRDAGGKLVSFHGLADHIIPPKGTEEYYNAVASILPDIGDFYRHYESPGLGHCFGGVGGQPTNLFAQLRAWVENGTAPGPSPVNITDQEGRLQPRILCPYPHKATFDVECGNSSLTECWSCIANSGLLSTAWPTQGRRGNSGGEAYQRQASLTE